MMSKLQAALLGLTLAVVAAPALTASVSAATVNRSDLVYSSDGQIIGQDPDPAIRAQLLRDYNTSNN
jgi:hypothetical protein